MTDTALDRVIKFAASGQDGQLVGLASGPIDPDRHKYGAGPSGGWSDEARMHAAEARKRKGALESVEHGGHAGGPATEPAYKVTDKRVGAKAAAAKPTRASASAAPEKSRRTPAAEHAAMKEHMDNLLAAHKEFLSKDSSKPAVSGAPKRLSPKDVKSLRNIASTAPKSLTAAQSKKAVTAVDKIDPKEFSKLADAAVASGAYTSAEAAAAKGKFSRLMAKWKSATPEEKRHLVVQIATVAVGFGIAAALTAVGVSGPMVALFSIIPGSIQAMHAGLSKPVVA